MATRLTVWTAVSALALGAAACGTDPGAAVAEPEPGDVGAVEDATVAGAGDVEGDDDAAQGDDIGGGEDPEAGLDIGAVATDARADAPDVDGPEPACAPVFDSPWARRDPAYPSGCYPAHLPVFVAPGEHPEVLCVPLQVEFVSRLRWDHEWQVTASLPAADERYDRPPVDHDGDGVMDAVVWDGEQYVRVPLDPARNEQRVPVERWVAEAHFSGPYPDGSMLALTPDDDVLTVCRVVGGERTECVEHAPGPDRRWRGAVFGADIDDDGFEEVWAFAVPADTDAAVVASVFSWDAGPGAAAHTFELPPQARDPWPVLGVGDVDGDGTPDIVGLQSEPWLVLGAGTDEARTRSLVCPTERWGCLVTSVFDTDLDGRAEIITTDGYQRSDAWTLDPQTLTWSHAQTLPLGTYSRAVDLDGGGDELVAPGELLSAPVLVASEAGLRTPPLPATSWDEFTPVETDALHERAELVDGPDGATQIAVVPRSSSFSSFSVFNVSATGVPLQPAAVTFDDLSRCTASPGARRRICLRPEPMMLEGGTQRPLREVLGWPYWPPRSSLAMGRFVSPDPDGLVVFVEPAYVDEFGIDGPGDAAIWALMLEPTEAGWQLARVIGVHNWTLRGQEDAYHVLDVDGDGLDDVIDVKTAYDELFQGAYDVLLLGRRDTTSTTSTDAVIRDTAAFDITFASLDRRTVAFARFDFRSDRTPRRILAVTYLRADGTPGDWTVIDVADGSELSGRLVASDLDVDGVDDAVITVLRDEWARPSLVAITLDDDGEPLVRTIAPYHDASPVGTRDINGDGIADLVIESPGYGVHVAWGRCAE